MRPIKDDDNISFEVAIEHPFNGQIRNRPIYVSDNMSHSLCEFYRLIHTSKLHCATIDRLLHRKTCSEVSLLLSFALEVTDTKWELAILARLTASR
jgi:hypothetical protein